MIEMNNDRLEISFPEVHKAARMSIDFQRTLRIPDDNETHYLPPGLGKFPLQHVDDYSTNLPSKWEERGGVFLPMYQSEALWINFRAAEYPFAVKIAAGKINAVTGELWNDDLSIRTQHTGTQHDYVVVPGQPWLDGFAIEKGIIRQFVAMPLGQGFTAEEQLTGDAEFGGIQIIAYPLKRERYSPPRREELDMCMSVAAPVREMSMGLGLGGRMKQEIFRDEYGLDAWDTGNSSRCFVHIANSKQYHEITGSYPPNKPPSVESYNSAGLPWFDYYDENATSQPGSEALAGLQSIESIKSSSKVDGIQIPVVITPKS
jgi:hypothetical protein